MTEFLSVVGIGVGVLAAVAAWKAAAAARASAEVAEKAALLGSIPLLVPWVESNTATLKVYNRGSSTAHEIEWSITVDNDKTPKTTGSESTVLPAGSSRPLTASQDGVVASLRTAAKYVIRCEYITSWGEQLTIERTSLAGKTRHLRLYDAEGQHLSIR